LSLGLARTGSSLAQVFTGTRIDDALYEELESALLMADAGAEGHRAPAGRPQAPGQGRHAPPSPARGQGPAGASPSIAPAGAAAAAAGRSASTTPTVIMVAGVNGAGKTTSIGKLDAPPGQPRRARRRRPPPTPSAPRRASSWSVWADRNTGRDRQPGTAAIRPAVTFDAVTARAGPAAAMWCSPTPRDALPTQLHLMEELKKIKRVHRQGRCQARRTRCCW
jgi:fused signal recognition particle receptor